MSDLPVRALLTYLLHSSVLLGVAALVRHSLGERRLALQEALLRAALVGAFATSALQLGLELRPLGGALVLPAAAPAVPAPGEPDWHAGVVVAPTFADRVAQSPRRLGDVPWRAALTAGWGALAALALLRLAVAALRLRHLLRDRAVLRDARLAPQAARMADALGLRSSVRLCTAPHLAVPLATGVLRPEVCLPTRALAELSADEQLALCAHELAHVARRDPAWILVARVAEALAPVQPLNSWARRRLQELSECLSDDLAVAVSARPVGLARSLVDVASWTLAERPVLPAAAAGALSARSRLGHRVERLMDPRRSLERPRRSFLPLASAAVLATAFLTPVVSATVSGDPEAAAQPVVPQAAPAPPAEPSRTALERQVEPLGRQIEARAPLDEKQTSEIDRQVQELTARLQPNEAELQRLGKEMEAVAQELADSALENAGQPRDGASHAQAVRRMAELREQLRAQADKARAIAERTRPTRQEMEQLRRLSRELASSSVPDLREVSRQTRQAMEQARQAMRAATDALRQAAREAGSAAEAAKQRE